jgi:hypothetical protein
MIFSVNCIKIRVAVMGRKSADIRAEGILGIRVELSHLPGSKVYSLHYPLKKVTSSDIARLS